MVLVATGSVRVGHRRANRRDIGAKTTQLRSILTAEELRQPPATQAAYAAIVTSQVALIEALNTQVDQLGEVVAAHFGRHPDASVGHEFANRSASSAQVQLGSATWT